MELELDIPRGAWGLAFRTTAAGAIRLSSGLWFCLELEAPELRDILFQGQRLAFQLSKAFPDYS